MFEQIIPIIKENNDFLLISHISPDGDTLGSALALADALSSINKSVSLVCDNQVPEGYAFLPWSNKFQLSSKFNKSIDLCITIDCSDLQRTGLASEFFHEAKSTINIDHHISNTLYGDYNIVDSKAAATGEIIYKLIKALNILPNQQMAECIYTAISTDTGSFCYENTTPETHRLIAEMLELSIDVAQLSNTLYHRRTLAKTILIGQAISSLEIMEGGQIAMIYVTQHMMAFSGASENDCDGIVNYAKEVDGVEVAVLIKEIQQKIYKISLRSQTYVDVSIIAREYNGGGHVRAAGCTMEGALDEVKKQLIKKIKKVIGSVK